MKLGLPEDTESEGAPTDGLYDTEGIAVGVAVGGAVAVCGGR